MLMHVIGCNEIYYIVLQIHYMSLHHGGFANGFACMSSKFYCRSGWSEYFRVHSTSLRRGKTTWTLLGRRPRVRHGQHAARLGIRWLSSRPGLSGRLCTSMRLGAAWRLIACGLCMVPALPGRPRCPRLLVHDVTCHYMMIHCMKLHSCNSL